MFNSIHHIAIICSDYEKSKDFYVNKLGFEIVREVYRKERDSYMLHLALNGQYVIELFSFPHPPKRVDQPEACGLRHLAFEVNDIEKTVEKLTSFGIQVEPIRIGEHDGNKYTFFKDPDGLPLEIYEK